MTPWIKVVTEPLGLASLALSIAVLAAFELPPY
jgi:hypothetical protein